MAEVKVDTTFLHHQDLDLILTVVVSPLHHSQEVITALEAPLAVEVMNINHNFLAQFQSDTRSKNLVHFTEFFENKL